MERAMASQVLRLRGLLLECGETEAHLCVLDLRRPAKELRKTAVLLVNRHVGQAPRTVQDRLSRILRTLLDHPFPHDHP